MLPDLPEPEAAPQAEAVAANGMAEVAEPDAETGEAEAGEEETAERETAELETGEEETGDTGAPATLELTTAAREANAALDAEKDEEEEPKPALPMQKPAPKWAQTSPAGEEEVAEGQEDGEQPAAARPKPTPAPEWARTVPETALPVTEGHAPIHPDAKPARPMAKE